jgi:hypothetical protein
MKKQYVETVIEKAPNTKFSATTTAESIYIPYLMRNNKIRTFYRYPDGGQGQQVRRGKRIKGTIIDLG